MSECDIPAKYDLETIEAVVLRIAAELHPEHFPLGGFTLKIVSDPDDAREVETVAKAIDSLREFGLVKDRGGEIVELTPAALRAVALFG